MFHTLPCRFIIMGRRNKRKWKSKDQIRRKKLGSRYIEKSVRDEAFERDDGRCVYCGIKERKKSLFKRPVKLQFGHFYPYSKGGNNCIANIQLECANCNLTKMTDVWKINWFKRTLLRGVAGCKGRNCSHKNPQ